MRLLAIKIFWTALLSALFLLPLGAGAQNQPSPTPLLLKYRTSPTLYSGRINCLTVWPSSRPKSPMA